MKRSVVLVLGIIMALTLMGLAYAAWTSSVTIEGTINTGTLDIKFVDVSSTDSGNGTDPGTDKHVATTSVRLSEDGDILYVTVENAYPGYSAGVKYKVQNAGSVPAKIKNLVGTADRSNPEGDIEFELPEPGQVVDGQATTREFTVTFECGDNIVQGEQYIYTLTIDAGLWTE